MGVIERALIVDDDVAIRLMLTRVLQREHFEVDSARDGVEAIEKICSGAFDIIFLDLMMPRIDGITVLRHIRKNAPELLPKIVVMTAFHKIADEVCSADQSVGMIVEKPFDIVELVRHARNVTSLAPPEEVANPS